MTKNKITKQCTDYSRTKKSIAPQSCHLTLLNCCKKYGIAPRLCNLMRKCHSDTVNQILYHVSIQKSDNSYETERHKLFKSIDLKSRLSKDVGRVPTLDDYQKLQSLNDPKSQRFGDLINKRHDNKLLGYGIIGQGKTKPTRANFDGSDLPVSVVTMLPRSDDVRHMTDESLAPFHWNRRGLPRKQRQHERSSKGKRQLVKRNPPSSSVGTDLRISSPNTFTRNVSKPNNTDLDKLCQAL
ncbi:unnamed protein product, partial [Protopolystoma xenopodis]